MTTIRASVEKAYPNDTGRGIVRLGRDENGLLSLRLSPGDCVEIEGNDTTVAKVWRADRDDEDGIVRLDRFTRENADVDTGESVDIHKADPENADSLALAPPEEAPARFDSEAVSMIKRQLHEWPVTEHDIAPVKATTNRPLVHSPGQTIPFIVIATEPNGAVLVTSETSVTIRQAGG